MATSKQIRRRGRLSLILGAILASVMLAAIAYADNLNVDGDILSPASNNVDVTRGGGFTARYTLGHSGGDGCNADASNPVTVTTSIPSAGSTGVVWNDATTSISGCTAAGAGDASYTVGSTAPLGSQATLRGTPSGGKPGNNGFQGPNAGAADFDITVIPRGPTNLASPSKTSSSISLSWTVSPDDGDISNYQLERSGNAAGPWSLLANPAKGAANASYTDNSLNEGTQYCYRLAARFQAGGGVGTLLSSYSMPLCVTTPAANTAPTTPGAPALAAGSATPNQGVFTLTWDASTDGEGDDVTYELQHKDANDADWSGVPGAGALTSNSFSFTSGAKEDEGTWTYRVQASDGSLTSAFSNASSAIKVDRTAPNSPSVSVDHGPEYNPTPSSDETDDWYKDSVVVTFAAAGDPNLPDGSPGSGVVSVTGAATVSVAGFFSRAGTATDDAGNVSAATTKQGNVDNQAPTVSFTSCPSPVLVGSTVSAIWSASDPGASATPPTGSGLASPNPASASISLDTSAPTAANPAPRTVSSPSATDNVGHTTAAASCVYSLVQVLFQPPIDGPSVVNNAKAGRVIPIKAEVFVNGSEVKAGYVSVLVNKMTSCPSGSQDTLEAYAAVGSATANQFVWDGDGDRWQYNLDTSANGMTAGSCYRANVNIGGSPDATGKVSGGDLAGYFLIKLNK